MSNKSLQCVICDATESAMERIIKLEPRNTIKVLCEPCHDRFHGVPKRRDGDQYGTRTVNRRVIKRPELMRGVEKIVELRNAGETWSNIVEYLIRNDYPTARGGEWALATVCSLYKRFSPAPQIRDSWRYGWDVQDGRTAKNVAEQQVIAWILDARADGFTFAAIARKLNEAGAPTKRGGSWCSGTVSTIFRREQAAGA